MRRPYTLTITKTVTITVDIMAENQEGAEAQAETLIENGDTELEFDDFNITVPHSAIVANITDARWEVTPEATTSSKMKKVL